MGKRRAALRQVPWQSWEHWKWVATELFSDCPDRIAAALGRITAWQSRGKVPIAVEVSASLVGIHQRDPHFNAGVSVESVLSEDLLRMMYAMAIQRLVNGVVDQSHKRNVASVADRADLAGLPRLLVDIRHEAAHTELPGLSLLHIASEQALVWLKSQYWDKQRETLETARNELKAKLVKHCLLVIDILFPSAGIDTLRQGKQDILDGELDYPQDVKPQKSMAVMKQQRTALYNELLDLSLASTSDLLSILVDDGMLEQDALISEDVLDGKLPLQPDHAYSLDLVSRIASAWKFTLKKLSYDMPQLPGLLLIAILRKINRWCSQREDVQSWTNQLGSKVAGNSNNSRATTEIVTLEFMRMNSLISWCAWLLGKKSSQDICQLNGQDAMKSKLLKMSNALTVKAQLGTELLHELLRECLCTSNGRSPLVELVQLISAHLGNKKFQSRALVLAQLGTNIRRVQSWCTDQPGAGFSIITKERVHEGPMMTTPSHSGEEGPIHRVATSFAGEEGPTHKAITSLSGEEGPIFKTSTSLSVEEGPIHNPQQDCSETSEGLWIASSEAELAIAKRRQRELLDRLSRRKPSSPNDNVCNDQCRVDAGTSMVCDMGSDDSLPSTGLGITQVAAAKRWTLVENWRPCAIGMIPSPLHGVGIVPSLELGDVGHGGPFIACQQLAGSLKEGKVMLNPNAENLVLSSPGLTRKTIEKDLDSIIGGKRPKRSGQHVQFVDPKRSDKAEIGTLGSSRTIVSEVTTQVTSAQKEQVEHGSLMQGCLLMHGSLVQVSSQELEALQSRIHVL